MAEDNGGEAPVTIGMDVIGSYYRGVVCKLHRGPERGRVRTAHGREIPFTFAHVVMQGERTRFTDLRDGMTVGYDVGWTSKGLRITVIRIPDPSMLSERELGAEEQEAPHHLADEHGEDGNVK